MVCLLNGSLPAARPGKTANRDSFRGADLALISTVLTVTNGTATVPTAHVLRPLFQGGALGRGRKWAHRRSFAASQRSDRRPGSLPRSRPSWRAPVKRTPSTTTARRQLLFITRKIPGIPYQLLAGTFALGFGCGASSHHKNRN